MKVSLKSAFPAIVCFLIFSLSMSCGEKEHPKDEKLIEIYQSHKNEFNQLLQMFQEDKSLGRVAPEFTRTANFFEECKAPNIWNGKNIEIGEARLSEYRKLFSLLELPAGIEGYCEKDIILFYASTKGLSVTGSSKGFAYLEEMPTGNLKIVENLDNYWSSDGKSFRAFRRIEGNWYLYFDYED